MTYGAARELPARWRWPADRARKRVAAIDRRLIRRVSINLTAPL